MLANPTMIHYGIAGYGIQGHAIGGHLHSHGSIGTSVCEGAAFVTEVIEPKRYVEQTFQTSTNALSYPFGEPAVLPRIIQRPVASQQVPSGTR